LFSLTPALLATWLLSACASPVVDAEPRPLKSVGGWVTYWDFASGLERLNATPGAIDQAFLFLADLSVDGRPGVLRADLDATRVVGTLRADGIATWLTAVNDRRDTAGKAALKDSALVHDILVDPARRAAHRRELVELTARHGVAGLDLDYENLQPADRDAFSAFVRELRADLQARDLQLSVTVQPKTQESRSVGPGAADWAQLCAASDRLQIMLYNLHSSKTGPGPLATKTWIASVLAFAASQCDPARVVPVLKLGAMDWGPAGLKELQHADLAGRLAARSGALERDPDGGSPFFRYEAPDGTHTVYYEDAASLLEKVAKLQELGYDSVVLWSLGHEDPQILPGLLARKNYQTRISSEAPTPQPE
jgi:spore germination protein YaaH